LSETDKKVFCPMVARERYCVTPSRFP